MAGGAWGNSARALASANELMRAPLSGILATLSTILLELIDHRALIMLTGDCPKSPLWATGDAELTECVSTTEMSALAREVDVGTPRFGRAVLAGAPRDVLAFAASPPNSAGALLAVVTDGDAEPPAATTETVQQLWDLTTARIRDLIQTVAPVESSGLLAGGDRVRAIADLADEHAATLSTLLAALRARDLDDATARRTAVDIAVSAIIRHRSVDDVDRVADILGEERADRAYTRLSDMLGMLSHYGGVTLEYSAFDGGQRHIPSHVTEIARTVARGCVLSMLAQDGISRIRVCWDLADTELLMTIRDDGPGTLTVESFTPHRVTDRVTVLGGSLELDAVPGWGATVSIRLPLLVREIPRSDLRSTLNPREVDVLRHLVLGHRNRAIAGDLHISEHTVKFHVARILKKLNAGSRGEAAAIARSLGFPTAALPRS
ncbi:LuxR C-terminal-related transcriptional regulator [Nocardia sp. NPDC052316]|uniref:helix-turn-helix transcriptional regulator n=1 Tax=Nocardia sp. NPDC052316 TaxID=3364329 RepID=UPI0037C6B363